MITKRELIELLQKQDDSIEIKCHINISSYLGEVNGDGRKNKISYTIEFTTIKEI